MSTYVVSGVQLCSTLTEEPDNAIVAPHSGYVERRFSLIVSSLQGAASLCEALNHILVAMPASTQQRSIPILIRGRGAARGEGEGERVW